MFSFFKDKNTQPTPTILPDGPKMPCPKGVPDCNLDHYKEVQEGMKSQGSLVLGDYAASNTLICYNSIILGPGVGANQKVIQNSLMIEIGPVMVHKKITDEEAFFMKGYAESVIKTVYYDAINKLPKHDYMPVDYQKAITDVKNIYLNIIAQMGR